MPDAYSFDDWQAGRAPPDGWDCADAVRDGWGKAELDAFMKASVRAWVRSKAREPAEDRREPEALAQPKVDERLSPPSPAGPVLSSVHEARSTQQAQPEPANVVQLRPELRVVDRDKWETGLIHNEDGGLKSTASVNWALWLENHPETKGTFWYNTFKQTISLRRCPPWARKETWKERAIKDTDYAEAAMWLEGLYMAPKPSTIAPIIQAIAERHEYDPLTDYIDGLRWDGAKRIGTWLTYYLGCEDKPYTRSVGRKMLISAVARALNPGCKCDTMVILEGEQGKMKSTALRALFSREFFTDEISDIGSKDASMELQGVWCVEVAEMQRFSNAETNAVKKFLTRQVDRYRPPYGRTVIEAPRRSIFGGTMNPDGNPYLRDPTGARRFWPVAVGSLDIEGIEADRDQLWAEAAHAFSAGEKWWMDADEEVAAKAEQSARTDVDVWIDYIVPLLAGRSSVSQVDIFDAIGVRKSDADWRHSSRVARVMKRLGWDVSRDGDRVMFKKPGATPTIADEPRDW